MEGYKYYLDSKLYNDPLAGDFDKLDTYSTHDDIRDTFDIIKRTKKGKCGEIFIEENDLFSFLCTLCEAPFNQIEQFYLHVKSKHNSLKHNDNLFTRTKCNNGEKPDKQNQQTDKLENLVDLVQNIKEDTRIENSQYQNTHMAKINEDDGCDDDNDRDNTFDKDSLINCNGKGKYSCNVCQKEYPFKSSIHRHIFMKHTPFSNIPDEYKCKLCYKHFENKQRKERHDRIHSGEKPFQCQFCKECFRTKWKCNAHEKRHTSYINKLIEDTAFTGAITNHKNSLNGPTENLNQQTFKLDDFIDQVENVEEKEIKIEINENFYEYDRSNDVQVQNVDEKEIKIEVHENPNEYDGSDDFQVQNVEEKEIKIEINENFYEYDRSNDVQVQNVDEKEIKIEINENSSEGNGYDENDLDKIIKNNFINRELVHTVEKSFSYETCRKSFQTKRFLESNEDVHGFEKQYKCQECNMRFRLKRVLNSHLSRHNDKNKRHKCLYCEKAFFRKGERDEHVTIHTNEKPFQCQHCGEKFRVKTTLRNHEKGHLGIRPFKCEHCDKTFIVKSTLTKHLVVHTRARPHTCSICNKSFSQRSSLLYHKKNIHHHEGI